jgi:hypothetical protein
MKKGSSGMAKKEKLRGLCATCVHASTCTYPRDPKRPVMHCEEFEGERKPQEPAPVEDNPGTAGNPDSVSPDREDDAKVKGLCRTCAKRDSCTYPKPEGGVWHCDEYE